MRKGYGRICALVLIVFVFISGFGIENIQRESPFLSFVNAQSNSFILPHIERTFNTQFCTIESLEMEESVVEGALINRTIYKKIKLHIFNIKNPEFLPHLGEKVYLNFGQMFLTKHFKEELVSNYIHKLDGKKRI